MSASNTMIPELVPVVKPMLALEIASTILRLSEHHCVMIGPFIILKGFFGIDSNGKYASQVDRRLEHVWKVIA